MPDKIRDNNTTKIKCGYLGNYFLNNAVLHISLLVMQKIVIKNFQLSFHQSKFYFYFQGF